jgi:GntR family transcriptional regulator
MTMSPLTRDPIYFQVNARLRDMIRRGEFAPGTQFLTERQISERFSISRSTANKALSNLVSEGVLEFRKGIGTFLRGEPLDYDLRSLVSFTEKARAAGRTPTTRIIDFEELEAGDIEPAARVAMKLEDGMTAFYMERLRLADDTPVILERRFLPSHFCPGLTRRDVEGSLYHLLTETLHLTLGGADEILHAVNLSMEDARLLGAKTNAAALQVTAVGKTEDSEPLWFERTIYRGDAYEIHIELGPMAHRRTAIGVLTRND